MKEITLTYDDLASTIIRVTIRSLKSKGMYALFRCFVGQQDKNSLMSALVSAIEPSHFYYYSDENPYMNSNTYEEIKQIMLRHCCNCDPNLLVKKENVQPMMITMLNHFLHYCLEGAVHYYYGSIDSMHSIGNDIFNAIGVELFGDDFVDETSKVVDQDIVTKLNGIDDFGLVGRFNPSYHTTLRDINVDFGSFDSVFYERLAQLINSAHYNSISMF